MNTETNQPRGNKDSDFGLPQAEFRPIPRRRGGGLRTAVILLFIMLAIGGGIAYWFFYHAPASSRAETYLDISQATAADAEFIEDGNLSPTPTPSEAKKGDGVQHGFSKSTGTSKKTEKKKATTRLATKISKGSITKISVPQGYYYIVVGSFIDDDLAADYAQKLIKKGINVIILSPEHDDYFFRVAVAQADTLYAAHEKIGGLKSVHGSKIWVKKY